MLYQLSYGHHAAGVKCRPTGSAARSAFAFPGVVALEPTTALEHWSRWTTACE